MINIKVKRSFVDGTYGQIHVRTAGNQTDKTPIVCLHMSPKSSRSYASIMPFLAKDRLVLAPDYPGYGESDPPPAEPPVSIADYARSVWEVVDHFGLKKVHIIGIHTGSMVAVEATAQRPDSVEKVINVGAPIFTEEEIENYKGYFIPTPLNEAGDRFRIMWGRIMEFRGPGQTLEMAAISMAENLRGGEAYEWGHDAAFEYSKSYNEKIAKIDHPLFVMNVKDDVFEVSRRVDPLLKNGYRKDFPNLGTGFMDVAPEAGANAMLAFLDED